MKKSTRPTIETFLLSNFAAQGEKVKTQWQIPVRAIQTRLNWNIVGMSGKFAQSENLEAFWKHLVAGHELVKFYAPEELEQLGVAEELIISTSGAALQ